ncbi:MAG TPA: radical SAM protein [Acidobacteriota bacterium]
MAGAWQIRERAERRLAAERGDGVRKPAPRLQLALGFPNTYFVGMSNLGFQAIHRFTNGLEGVACERFFLPDREERSLYQNQPGLKLGTLESGRPVADFELVAFSVSFENDYVHLLRLLELAGLPLLAAQRDGRHPLVVVGGAVTFINPEPLADFVDLIAVGEGEPILPAYLERFERDRGRPRREHLERAAALPGIYVPSLIRPPEPAAGAFGQVALPPSSLPKHTLPELASSVAYSSILTSETEFADTLLIEVSRGCPLRCRFCTVSYTYPKFRTVPPEVVVDLVRRVQQRDRSRGLPALRRVGLVSSDISDVPGLGPMCRGLVELGVELGVSSVRIDRLPPELLDALSDGGVQSLAVAPEAGSERLREVIRKPMSTETLLRGADQILERGVQNLKLYFILGLPTETADDVQAIIDLTLQLRERALAVWRRRGHAGKIVLSINPFVPKPLTPFQWSRMEPLSVVEAKLRTIRRALRTVGNVEVKEKSLRHGYLEALLSNGDRRLSAFLLQLHRDGGRLTRAGRALAADLESKLFGERALDQALPWDFIVEPAERARLRREYQRAMSQKPSFAPLG